MIFAGLIDVIHWLEKVFDRLQLQRSDSGAIAYNYYGPPRFTQDVDVLALVPDTKIPELLDEFSSTGCQHLNPEARPVEVDELQVGRVLANLVENANEWSPAGGKIAVGASAGDGMLTAWVENDGPAIAPTDLESVFDTFWTRRPRGSGLGLAICKRVVEAHGGTIRAENRRRGPRFTFTLPLARVPATR